MECTQCNGLMLKDYSVSMVSLTEWRWLCVWLCVDCGHAINPITMSTQPPQILAD